MTEEPHADVRRRAGWLPADQDALEEWLAGHRERAEANDTPLHPVIAEFQRLIDTDPVVRMYLQRMVDEQPTGRAYTKRHLESPQQLLRLINEVLTVAPEFGPNMVSTPLTAILDWTIGTTAGFAAYRDPRINGMFAKILNAWAEFLNGPESLYVLNDSDTGWQGAPAQQAVGMDQYEHDPAAEHWGFTSWNDFFTRRFKVGARPVANPDDDGVVVSACESTPYGITTDVQLRDRFWIKRQPYSLHDMLAGDEAAARFVGGTVYQAFLSANNYHRWHSPVAGTIVRAFVVPGTYFSEADSEGTDADEAMNSQAYISHVAARAVILIQADDPVLGLVAFVPVGMVEVSTCLLEPAIVPGYHVAKGEELGRFQFGGSTHCLVFEPGAISEFSLAALPQPHLVSPPLVEVRSRLAVAARSRT